jgi:3-oxoacyl-[acyl-carrier protein] reductase
MIVNAVSESWRKEDKTHCTEPGLEVSTEGETLNKIIAFIFWARWFCSRIGISSVKNTIGLSLRIQCEKQEKQQTNSLQHLTRNIQYLRVHRNKKMLILVTGASRGIGFELVKQLADSDGALVLAVSRNIKPLKKMAADKHNILPVEADITKAEGLKKVTAVVKRLDSPLKVIVNNAGLLLKKDFRKIKLSEISQVYHTNVFAPFLLVQHLLPFMSKNDAHIVNISSMGGVQGSSKFPGLSAYSSSKAALCGLTECLSEELKPQNITVNCLALGAVQTEMLGAAFPGYKAPLNAKQMAEFIADFSMKGHKFFNGKIIPVSVSTP